MEQNNSYELKLSIQNETIVSNLDVLKQALDTNFNKYSKVVYVAEDMDKDTYNDLKATRAKLNKLYKTFDDERKRVCDSNKKLITQCKKEVDDSISILKSGADNLSKYIEDYELLQKKKALEFARNVFEQVMKDDKYSCFKYPYIVTYESVASDELITASKLANNESKIKEYFTKRLNEILKDFNTIDTLDANYDQAYIKVLYINRANLDLNTALRMYQEKTQLRQSISKQIDTNNTKKCMEVSENETIYERTFVVKATKKQLIELSTFMNDNNILFKKLNS